MRDEGNGKLGFALAGNNQVDTPGPNPNPNPQRSQGPIATLFPLKLKP